MKRLVRFFTNDRLWQMVVALFLAVTLFFTAWSGNTQNKNNSSIASNTFTKTVESVPVDIKYDSDKYFISGYSYDAEVYLTATTQLALTTETTSDTRHFKLVADLSNFGPGTSHVPIQVKNLPDGMSAQVSPSTLTATIGKKASKTFDVVAKISLRKLSKSVPVKLELTGDKASNVSSISYSFDRGHVTIVGSQEAMDKIDSITVPVDISQVTKDTSKTLELKAEGVTVQPSTVKVNLKVTQK